MQKRMIREERITIAVTPLEKELMEKLANYLHAKETIDQPTISDVVRFAVFKVLMPLALKDIEARRFGGESGDEWGE